MRYGLIYLLLIITIVFATDVQAQQGAAESDPFHPSAVRPGTSRPEPSSGDSSWGRDPFNNPLAGTAPVQKGPPSAGFVRQLTGIIYSNDVRLAIIGGETYREGSMVGDRKLVSIRTRSIVLMSAAGEKEEVFLENFSISK